VQANIFLFGIIFGSFLNVCIYRLPQDQDVLLKASSCLQCKKKIKWYQNIPVASYLFLRGRCGYCKHKLDIQYPLVEILTGIIFVYAFNEYSLSLKFALLVLFLSSLLVIFFTDLIYYLILDVITFPLTFIAIISSILLTNPFQLTGLESLMGVAVGFLPLFLLRWFYLTFKKIEAIGLGDAKLMMLLGAWLGIKSILFILLVSSVLGVIVGIAIIKFMKKKKDYPIPYGCFLVFATILYLFYGQQFYNYFL